MKQTLDKNYPDCDPDRVFHGTKYIDPSRNLDRDVENYAHSKWGIGLKLWMHW